MRNNFIAQGEFPIGNLSGENVGIDDGSGDPVSTLAALLSTVIGLLTVLGAIYFMFNIIIGAIGIISSGGDKNAFQEAQKKITIGAIGFVVLIAGMFILGFIATILGLPDILDLGAMIEAIRLQ